MMGWGQLTVGRIQLRETYEMSNQVNATTGEQSVAMEGTETTPPWTPDQLDARQSDLVSMLDRDLPIVFSSKENQTGFYRVKDVGAKVTRWPEADFMGWNLTLARIGAENAVDMESRLGSVVRDNDHALTGERWHAPAAGAYAYFTGSTLPSGSLSRVMADAEGTLTVFRDIPAGVNPTWGITAPNYLLGRVRVLVADQERSGVGIRIATTDWLLTNGLVRVTPLASSGVLKFEAWDGAAWSSTDLAVQVNTALSAPFDAVTILRNDFETVVIRLVKSKSPGRTLVDLTLRRGSRFVEGFIQTDVSTTIGVTTQAAMAGTAGTGYVRQTANDANGNRLVVGSPRTHTANTTNTGLSIASTTTLPFFVGSEIDGSSAVSGEAAADLMDQYIGALTEQTLAVKR